MTQLLDDSRSARPKDDSWHELGKNSALCAANCDWWHSRGRQHWTFVTRGVPLTLNRTGPPRDMTFCPVKMSGLLVRFCVKE